MVGYYKGGYKMLIMDQLKESLSELEGMFVHDNLIVRESDSQILGEYHNHGRAKKVLWYIVYNSCCGHDIYVMPEK